MTAVTPEDRERDRLASISLSAKLHDMIDKGKWQLAEATIAQALATVRQEATEAERERCAQHLCENGLHASAAVIRGRGTP